MDSSYIFYLDNFRGFQDTFIPINDVNFCVGENSSGKTSFLSLINIFASRSFWIKQKLTGDRSGFRHFDDIVSVQSKKRDYFSIGFIKTLNFKENDRDNKSHEEKQGVLFTYKKKDGMPQLYKCSRNVAGNTITVIYTDKTVKYKLEKNNPILNQSNFKNKIFQKWIEEHKKTSISGYQLINDELFTSRQTPMLYVFSYLYQILFESNKPHPPRPLMSLQGPQFFRDIAWIAPIRTKPKRTYDEAWLFFSPEGGHTPYILKKILEGGESSERFSKFVKKFGETSGLFKKVNVHKFGNSVTSPFELEIVLESKPLNISSVGYGVSQILPLIVELFARKKDTWFAIQQPEVHLHPRAQAAFGELIYELSEFENKRFIVETHSDFTIDRYRISVRENKAKCTSQVLFFERRNGRNYATPIPIESDGEYSQNQPSNFRTFFLKEELRVLGAL